MFEQNFDYLWDMLEQLQLIPVGVEKPPAELVLVKFRSVAKRPDADNCMEYIAELLTNMLQNAKPKQ